MSSQFKITSKENPNNYEELGLNLYFFEQRLRGQEKIRCVVMCEEVSGVVITDTISMDSWESMKEEFPTLKSILVAFAHDDKWSASWRNNERVAFVESVVGNEGLYDVNKTVFYDYQDDSPMVEFKAPAKKMKK